MRTPHKTFLSTAAALLALLPGSTQAREIWGYTGYSRGGQSTAFVAFQSSGTPNFRTLLDDSEGTMSPNGGGALHNGFYDVIHYSTTTAGRISLMHYQYTSDWRSTMVPTSETDLTLIATETATSKITGRVYGQFYDAMMQGFQFGVIDYDNMTRTTIATSLHKYLALGVSSQEQVYGVCTDGNLYRIDPSTGVETLVGPTGVDAARSEYESFGQSGEIDQDDDVFYWAAMDANQHAALYTVDLNTGAATKLYDFPGNEQILGMAIPDAVPASGAPAAAQNLSVAFDGASTSGTVSFTAPRSTYGGASLSGTLNYTIKSGRTVLAEGQVSPGATVTAPISSPEGQNYYQVQLSNAAGGGPVSRTSHYVGYDQPMPPSNAILAISGNQAVVTWTAPRMGVNGGYVGPLTYTVTRNPGNVVVASNFEGTRFTEAVGSQLSNYSYGITAVNGTKRSAETWTNTVKQGSYIQPPYTEAFGAQTDFDLYTTIDANRDNNTWTWHEELQCAQLTMYNNEGDDWLVTPPVQLQAGHQYTLSFRARNSLSFYSETIEAKYGNSATVAGLTETMVPSTTLAGGEWRDFSWTFSSDRDQVIYLGIHGTGANGTAKILVDDITVDDGGNLQGPAAVTGLNITPAGDASLRTSISFNAPTSTVDGGSLNAISRIVVAREGVTLHEFTSPTPGQALTFEDNTPTEGRNHYTVTGYTSAGAGAVASVYVWVGLDTPSAPADVRATASDNGVQLSWAAPTVGVNGGVVLQNDMFYNVYRRTLVDEEEVLTRIGDTSSATYNVELSMNQGAQQTLRYAVRAENDIAEGPRALSPVVISGQAYTLPFHSGFTGADLWWNDDTDETAYAFTANAQQSADNDGHCLIYTSTGAGAAAQVYSGKISLAGATSPQVIFSHKANPGHQDLITVTIQAPDGASETLGTVNYTSLGGNQSTWNTSVFDIPTRYLNYPYVIIGFRASGETFDAICLDNVSVRDVASKDLALSMEVPSSLKKGTKATATISVENRGKQAAGDFTVTLTAGGKQVYENVYDTQLAPQARATFTAEFTVPANAEGSQLQLTANVEYDEDEVAENNSASVMLPLRDSDIPAPNSVTGTQNGEQVTLTWTEPWLYSKRVTENFDGYANWTIDRFGDWTTYSSNKGAVTGGLWGASGYPFEHEGQHYVYIIFNPDAIMDGITSINPSLKPHSGDRCAMAMYSRATTTSSVLPNDDWLISPMLSGEDQTISFWVNNGQSDYYNVRYPASFECLYSTTTTDPEAFVKVGEGKQSDAHWSQQEFDLPSGALYFAIRCTTPNGRDSYMFLVDDVQFYSGYGLLTGYNIYRDGQLIGTAGSTAESFTDSRLPWGTHTYSISAVYPGGESRLVTALTATGISSVDASEAPALPIYDLRGQQVGTTAAGSQQAPGVYIINGRKVVRK